MAKPAAQRRARLAGDEAPLDGVPAQACDLCGTLTPRDWLQPEAYQEWDALCPRCFCRAHAHSWEVHARAQRHAAAQALLADDVQRVLAAHPALAAVLDEIAAPLHACFGPHTAVLEVLEGGEESDVLRLTIHLPHANAQDAAAALARFDETWWVHHCHRTGGLLVVDYLLEGTP